MNFQFSSFAEFIEMAGHGPFVWAAYVVTLVTLIALIVLPSRGASRFIAQEKKRLDVAERRARAAATVATPETSG
ncbi:heme exporter protein CcmD [Biformimicrobium ophioploci]|uniref:Heme exporter protein D n=1 Tax=Biformimicrobium ophioploci TaxID=3036711 RepID=A0ABQ6LZZ2_9GAMM|nr:heme exporter protein CcmD [Microbulbifer sp. NKW57]GMG87651.1 hypothetical protein MNKW57_19720 [Microbulbifer sp. NKW57]